MIILKNNDSVEHIWSGQLIQANTQIEIDNEHFRLNLINNNKFLQDLEDGKAVINNGTQDLSSNIGLLFLKKEVNIECATIYEYFTAGGNPPALTEINGAVAGYTFAIGDSLYMTRHLSHYINGEVIIRLFFAINNIESNRWIKFKLNITTSCLCHPEPLNQEPLVLYSDEIEVPTIAFNMFKVEIVIPESEYEHKEYHTYMKLERIDISSGKINPINSPILVKGKVIYFKGIGI
jgi:hypothetical protein